MRIAHTSDLHLDSQHPERWEALQVVLEKAKDEKVDYLVIAGDLFDDVESAGDHVVKLRGCLTGLPFKVVVIPGNHDYVAFESERDMGDDVIVLSRGKPLFKDPNGRISFFTVPYLKGVTNEYFYEQLSYIYKNVESTPFNVFVYHGDLDEIVKRIKYRNEATGKEHETAFSLSIKILQKFPAIKLVFSGHYHTYGEPISIDGANRFVAYSGAPVSITRNDLGSRYLLIYDVDFSSQNVTLQRYPLDTFHFEELEIYLNPVDTGSLEDYIVSCIESFMQKSSKKSLLLKLKGYINSKEQQINEVNLKDLIKKYCNDKWSGRVVFSEDWFAVLDVAFLIDKPFSRNILQRIEGLDLSENDKRTLKEWFILTLSKVYSQKGRV